jgi:hypothetical protein
MGTAACPWTADFRPCARAGENLPLRTTFFFFKKNVESILLAGGKSKKRKKEKD